MKNKNINRRSAAAMGERGIPDIPSSYTKQCGAAPEIRFK